MSYKIVDISQIELNEFFLNDPKLSYLGLPDLDLAYLYEKREFPIHPGIIHKGIFINNELVCVMKWEVFTAETGNFHMYVTSKLQKIGFTPELQKIIYQYFIDNTNFIKGIIMIPSTCEHVQRSAKNFGFKVEGRLTKAMRWRKELVDIIIYAIEFKREA